MTSKNLHKIIQCSQLHRKLLSNLQSTKHSMMIIKPVNLHYNKLYKSKRISHDVSCNIAEIIKTIFMEIP